MGAINLANIMDAIADTAVSGNVMATVHPYPKDSITAPCGVVGYPTEDIEFDTTFKRGSDRAVFPLYVLVGKSTELSARNALSAVMTGATGVKDVLDGTLGDVVQTARVQTCSVQEVTVGAITYLAARFDIEVYS